MPTRPRRQYRKRRSPGLKRAQRKVERVQRKKAVQNKDTHSYKLVREFMVPLSSASPPSLAKNYIGTYQPLALSDGSYQSVWTFPEFAMYCNQYDRVRINSVTIQWIPKANVFDAEHVFIDTNVVSSGDMCFHTVIDQDSRAPLNIATLQRYSSYKKFRILKPWKRTMRMTYPKGYWLNCQGPLSDANTLQSIGGGAYLTAYAEDLPVLTAATTWNDVGSFKIVYNVVFQGKQTPKLTVNEDGSVLLHPMKNIYSLPPTDIHPRGETTLLLESDIQNLGENLPCDCTGPTGPAGKAGPQGDTGPTGPTGDTGPSGGLIL